MKNQSEGNSWNLSGSLSKSLYHGLTLKGSYSYGDGHNTIDPGTTAGSSFNLNQHAGDPNNPGLGRSQSAQGHRVFVNASYNRSYFGFGATTIAAFWEASPSLNGAGAGTGTTASYVFAGDMNGDGGSGNDLIYIPRDMSEMNFVAFAAGGVNVYRRTAGAGVRGVHQSGRVPAQAPRRVRRAWWDLEPAGQEDGPEHYSGHLPRHRRQAQRGAVPHRLHELRKPT